MKALYETLEVFHHIRNDFPVYYEVRHLNVNSDSCMLHWHEWIEILYVISGKLAVWCNGVSATLGEGQMLVINPYEFHSTEVCSDNTVNVIIQFDLSMIKSIANDFCDDTYISKILYGEIVFANFFVPNTDLLAAVQSFADTYARRDNMHELLIKSEMFKLLYILLRNYISKTAGTRKQSKGKTSSQRLLVDSALTFINKNYNRQIGISDIAFALHVSESHLNHLFKAQLHVTPIAYLNTLRCDYAYKLLKTTDLTIREICALCGYNDNNYFSRLFKKLKGFAPSQCRLLQRND